LAACRTPRSASQLYDLSPPDGRLRVIEMDVTKPESVNASVALSQPLIDDYGLDYVINNAGVVRASSLGSRAS